MWCQSSSETKESFCHKLAHLTTQTLTVIAHLSPLPFTSFQAMDLEVPVLARNIPGNSAVVKHEVTGLLFSDPQVKESNFPVFIWSESFSSACGSESL